MSQPRLHGRDRELQLWAETCGRLAAGAGGTLAFTGRAGIGKTVLLEHAAAGAAERGWQTLRAANTPLNASLPGNVLWQWFARLVRSTPEGALPFDGPGELVRRLVLRAEHTADAAALGFAAAWVLRSLADAGPVVCLVDDAQWTDDLSLDVLATLAPLVADEPVTFVLGVRESPDEPLPDRLAEILDRAGTARAVLQPLKHRDVLAWLSGLGVDAVRDTASRIQIASAGVPYFVQDLIAGLDRGAEVDDLGLQSAQALLVERVHGLPERDREVLCAIALLGEQAVDEHLVGLTGHDADDLAAAYAELRAQRLVGAAYPPRVSHGLVGSAAVDALSPLEVSQAHGRIARLLRDAGEHRSVVAGHLLETRPDDDAEVARLLVEAAAEALALGSPALASRLAERGLRQVELSYEQRGTLLDLAARARLADGDAAGAVELWGRDLDHLDVPARIRRHLDIGDAHFALGSLTDASAAFGRARDLLESGAHLDPDAEAVVISRLFGAGFLGGVGLAQRDSRLARILEQDPRADRAGDRALLAQESMRMVMAGEDAAQAGELAARALRGRHLMHEEQGGGSLFAMALSTLMHTDGDAEALDLADAGLDLARRNGAVLDHATIAYTRGILHVSRGRLRLAQADLESAVAARELGWTTFLDIAVHLLVQVHLLRDEVEAVPPLLELLPVDAPRNAMFAGMVRHAHASHAASLGDDERALQLLSEAMEVAESFGGPAFTWWRRDAIAVALRLGRTELARAWADEELRTSEQYGGLRSRAFALVAAAPTRPFEAAVPMLREAIAILGRVEARVLLAEADLALARLLLEHADGHPDRAADAIELARRGLALADQVGAARVARGLAALLEETDTDVERGGSLVDRLTASELTVCRLAAQGLSNRQIAEHLFVTVKGVEWHLSRSYAKLGISSRRELAGHLATATELA